MVTPAPAKPTSKVKQSTSPKQGCATCQAPTTRRCAGCNGIPHYDSRSNEAPYYCSTACQKTDRRAHRSQCRDLRDWRALHRAGEIYQLVFYAWSELVFQNTTSGLTYEKDSITAHRRHLKYVGFTPFPPVTVVPQVHKNAILAANQCTNALGFFYSLLDMLLKNITVDSHELSVNIQHMPRRIIWQGVDGIKDPMTHRHEILGVQLRNGEHFIIDATSAQFGFSEETVVTWEKYLESRSCRVRETRPFGYWSRNIFSRWSPDPATVAVRKTMDEIFNDPVIQSDIRRSIVDASNLQFAKVRNGFVGLVRGKIEDCIAELHGPHGIFEKIHGHSVLRTAPLEDHLMLEQTLGHGGDEQHELAKQVEVEVSKDAITGIFPCIARHLQQSLKIKA